MTDRSSPHSAVLDEQILPESSNPPQSPSVEVSGSPSGSIASHDANGEGDKIDAAQLDQASESHDAAYDLMVKHLYDQAISERVMQPGGRSNLLSLRKSKSIYVSYPPKSHGIAEWNANIALLNVESLIRFSSDAIRVVLSRYGANATEVYLDNYTRIQLLETVDDLVSAKRHQKAAFVREDECLVLWADDAESLVQDAHSFNVKLISSIWSKRRSTLQPSQSPTSPAISTMSSFYDGPNRSQSAVDLEKIAPVDDEAELKGLADETAQRPIMIYSPITTALSCALAILSVGLGLGQLLKEYELEGGAFRFALMVTFPFTLCIASYFYLFIIGSIWQIIGPVSQLKTNSRFYSGVKPTQRPRVLPAVTIVMPVYKESFETVLRPTIESLKVAMTTYERQGGTVRLLICEDGMQCLDPEIQAVRREYYDVHDISWIARPPHGQNGYIRKGKFKKASNMNFAFELSLRVEELLSGLKDQAGADPFALPADLYHRAFEQAVQESDGKAWAAGNIRISDYLLIVDCDTRVPSDCFLDACSEMESSPDLAILQHESGVMKVIGNYFENGIAFFTERVNKSISYACASGEVAPFVGHNAFLRWSAMQDVSFLDEQGNRKIWSESHVSEDFDMSLRLQLGGYTLRWATYHNGEFREGVSLSVTDELNRWQKYAYGCNELLFRPLRQWWRGPISPLIIRYIGSDVPLHSKISVFSYIFSYYAIAASVVLSLINWLVEGLFRGYLDGFYLDAWRNWFTIAIIFMGLGNFSSAILSYRRQDAGLASALLNHIKWIPFFFIFFGGMPYHLSVAIVAHLIGYNITWEGTIKEATVSNFFKEIPAILKRFWVVYIMCFAIAAAMIVMATDLLPHGYRFDRWIDSVPLACVLAGHFLLPIVLNPWLMYFHF